MHRGVVRFGGIIFVFKILPWKLMRERLWQALWCAMKIITFSRQNIIAPVPSSVVPRHYRTIFSQSQVTFRQLIRKRRLVPE